MAEARAACARGRRCRFWADIGAPAAGQREFFSMLRRTWREEAQGEAHFSEQFFVPGGRAEKVLCARQKSHAGVFAVLPKMTVRHRRGQGFSLSASRRVRQTQGRADAACGQAWGAVSRQGLQLASGNFFAAGQGILPLPPCPAAKCASCEPRAKARRVCPPARSGMRPEPAPDSRARRKSRPPR